MFVSPEMVPKAGGPSVMAISPDLVSAGALGPEIPTRDLWLSPVHAILLDGVLVPVTHLIPQTIVQAEAAGWGGSRRSAA